MMKDTFKILIVFLLCIGAAAFFFDTCNPSQHSVKSDTVTVYKEKKIYIQPSPITIEKTTVRRLILSPAGGSVDSLFLKKIIAQKDSLRAELKKHKAKELLVLDTITKNRDTLHIAADCISAQMSVLMKFAPQQHTIQIPTTTITTTITEPASIWEKSLWFALGVGSGYMAHSLAQ
jgi:hypothetical protein